MRPATNKGEGTLADTKNRNRMAASSGNAIDEGYAVRRRELRAICYPCC